MSQKNTATKKSSDSTVEVLYQKMGDRWFAFSLVNNDVFVGSITQEEIDALESGQKPVQRRERKLAGNS